MMKNMRGIIRIHLLWQICLYLIVNVQETFQSPNLLDTHQLKKKGYIQVPNCNCTIDECDYYLSWEKVNDTEIRFEYSAKVVYDTPWIAFGLNTQPQMPDTSVIDCIVDGSKFIIQASYNPDHYNSVLNNNQLGLVKGTLEGSYSPGRVYCNFTRLISVNKSDPESSKVDDLHKPYYVLFAHGKADNGVKREHDQSPFVSTAEVNFLKPNAYGEDGTISRSPYIKAHATIMIVAWMVLASFGIVTSRYLQKEWMKGITIRGKPLWFRIHQFCVLATLGLTFAGVLIIFKGLNWSFKPPELHPLLGLIVAGLLVLNPIIGFARPPLDSPNRPAFHWIHGIIGHGTHLLSVVTMFFGLRHGQPTMPDWGSWVVIGFGVWRISIDIVLSIMARFDKDPFDYRAMADREEGTHEKWSSWRCSVVVIYMVVTIAAALSLVVFVNLDYKGICIS